MRLLMCFVNLRPRRSLVFITFCRFDMMIIVAVKIVGIAMMKVLIGSLAGSTTCIPNIEVQNVSGKKRIVR